MRFALARLPKKLDMVPSLGGSGVVEGVPAGGVVEAKPEFRDWFLDKVRENTSLRAEQRRVAEFALVPVPLGGLSAGG